MLVTGAVDEHSELEEILHRQSLAVVLQELSLHELSPPVTTEGKCNISKICIQPVC